MAIVDRVVRGAAWAGVGYAVQALLSMVTLAMLGRLVGPAGFGLLALAFIVVDFVETLTVHALADPIVQYKDKSRRRLDSVAWTIIIISVVIALAIAIEAGTIASMMGMPEIAGIIPWCAATLPIAAIGAVPVAILKSEVRTRDLTAIDAVAQIGSATVGIALAMLGWGVMSLVVMELVRQVIRTGGAVLASRYLPGRHGSLQEAWSLLPSNAVTIGLYVSAFADRAAPRALVGMFLGEAALGFFVLAFRLYDQLYSFVIDPMAAVALPAVVAAKDDPRELDRLVEGGFRLATALSFPVFVGFAVVAGIAVPILLGPQWAGAGLPAAILALNGVRGSTGIFTLAILRATGRSVHGFLMVALSAVVGAAGVALAAPYGLAAAMAAIVIRTYLTWPFGIVLIRRSTGISVRRQLAMMRAPAIAVAVMAAVVLAAEGMIGGQIVAAVKLGILVTLGASVYLGLLAMLRPDYVRLLLELVGKLRGRASPAV